MSSVTEGGDSMIGFVVLQTTFEWAAIGLLITLLIAVGTGLGAIIKIAYDTSQELGIMLHGPDDDSSDGFITESRERHEKMENAHDQVYEQLLIQGRLLSELSHSFAEIAEELEEQEDVDVSVNLDRIERLRDKKDDDRWDDEQAGRHE